ncbi:M28 family peptidase [Humisphaera borealis]|nr:M28 family peptidase [Humisphaera borealis]
MKDDAGIPIGPPPPMPGETFAGPMPAISDDERRAAERMQSHVQKLAGDIGERNIWRYAELNSSADYIERILTDAGYKVGRQTYECEGKTVANLDATLAGGDPKLADEIVLVGAHYDSVKGCPGANDNATGVAGGLELARSLAKAKLARSVRFAFFVNEEPPFFHSPMMGSVVYAKRCKERGEMIVAMLSLETMGFYSDDKDSQKYPPPFDKFFPDTGNFIGFVGDTSATDLVSRCVESFRSHTKFPSQGCAVSDRIQGIGWSDHWSFTKQGYPALMVTDTAPFRYRHYHTAEDTPEKVDYEKLARVTAGIGRVVQALAK